MRRKTWSDQDDAVAAFAGGGEGQVPSAPRRVMSGGEGGEVPAAPRTVASGGEGGEVPMAPRTTPTAA
jgi:hypothetical protein